jgi:hypothetical protein
MGGLSGTAEEKALDKVMKAKSHDSTS